MGDFALSAFYFRFERGDALMQFINGKRVEILKAQGFERVVASLRQGVVHVHEANVDAIARAVNMAWRTGTQCDFVSPFSALAEKTESGGMTLEVISRDMRAIGFESSGGPEVLQCVTLPIPAVKEDEVLIRVHAAGVNRPDIAQRAGKYPPPAGASPVMGLEVSGVVVQVGDKVDENLLGRAVCALCNGGGYAEYVAVPAGQCLPVPQGYDMIEAAALPETLFTVWTNVFERAYAVEGDTVLVHGGTSGIGTMAIALCKLFDVKIIVTCGSDEKCMRSLDWGADHAINYRTQDFVDEVLRITDGQGCNAVLDMVGGDYLPRNLRCLSIEGRHVSIAMLGGAKAEIFIPDIMTRRLTLTGSTLRPRSTTFKSLVADEISRHVWPYVASGRLRPAMDRVFALEDVAAAHRRMEAGEHFGKIVLKVGD